MIKPLKQGRGTETIEMGEMKPYDIGRIIGGVYNNEIVMRTASLNRFEVMSLSKPENDRCWPDKNSLKVALFPSGTTFTLEVE